MASHLFASVIISTYNKPEYLDLVLHSYALQTQKDFEIIVADDGSDERTKVVIENFSSLTQINVIHVWHEDNGFQKTKILNKAIVASNTNYLIFTDGDCVARKDFVATHKKLSAKKQALSGGYFKLTDEVSKRVSKQVIEQQSCFEKGWLISKGQPLSLKLNKLTRSKFKAKLLNLLTPTKATFDGMNVSCYKEAILAVNGFDERMQYGGEDRELGERLVHYGIKFKQIRYSAICVHLYHERPYKNSTILTKNQNIRKQTKKEKATYTSFGIVKGEVNFL